MTSMRVHEHTCTSQDRHRSIWSITWGQAVRQAAPLRLLSMLSVLSVLSVLLSCTRAAGPRPALAPLFAPSATLAFTGVTVVDVTDGTLHPEQTVVIMGTHITALGSARTVRVPVGAQRVDARGKYLIPGLWDMHIHVMGFPEVFYPLLIANGVTGIRDMGTPIPLDTVHQWQREVTQGTRVGPRQINAGASLDDGGPTDCVKWHDPQRNCPFRRYQFLTPVGTPERARFLVDSLQAAGADFIKVHDLSSPAILFAVAAEARRRGIPFAGHANASFLESADSGQRSFEHDVGSGWCFNAGATDERCRQLAEGLRRHNAWVVVALGSGAADVSAQEARVRLRYWPDSVTRGLWLSDSAFSPGKMYGWGQVTQDGREFARRAHAVQLPLLVGTDQASILPWLVPGFSLQDEVVHRVENGYPALDALQAVTLNPAKYLEATDSLGSVAQGKLADLVLLDADPLADIHNLRKIRAVVANGRYFDRAALDALLAGVEQRGAARWARGN